MNEHLNRREFILKALQIATFTAAGNLFFCENCLASGKMNKKYYKRALYYTKTSGNNVKCTLCPNYCQIAPGQRGKCKVRENVDGELYTIVYNRAAVISADAIEKTPVFHFKPGLKLLSFGTAGCNLACKYCQNWQYSQVAPEKVKSLDLTPAQIVEKAKKSGYKAVGFFYTEPVIFYEYMYDTALAAKKAGLFTIMETAAFINPEPLKNLTKIIDVFAVTLKGYNNNFYRTVTNGDLETIKNALKLIKKENKHLEIINLIIPGYNDSQTEIKAMSNWIKTTLGSDTPLHFSRFLPEYKMKNVPETPIKTIDMALSTAKATGLKYVYVDNLPGHSGQNTVCPVCKKTIVTRVGFKVLKSNVKNSKCPHCSSPIPGNW